MTATARLTRADGTPIAGRTITFTAASLTKTATTDGSGLAVAVFRIEDHGKSIAAAATFAGDPPLEPSSASTTAYWGTAKSASSTASTNGSP